MPQPFDYNSILSVQPAGGMTDVVKNAIFGEQQRQQNDFALMAQQSQIAEAERQKAVAEERRQQQQSLWQAMAQAPTAQNVFGYMSVFPEISEGVKRAYDVLQPAQQQAELRTMVDVNAALMSGKIDVAKALLKEREESDAKIGIDTSHYGQLADILDQSPETATGLSTLALASVMGKDKFAETYGRLGEEARAGEMQPAKLRQEEAAASKAETEAQYAPETIEADLATKQAQRQRWAAQTANEQVDIAIKRSGLELERDKLESTIQLRLEEIDRQGTNLDAGARAEVNKAVTESASSLALSDRMNDLANRIKTTDMGYGWMSSAREAWKGAFGGQDPITGLRAEYNLIVNAQAVKNLPPGPASDKDIALAKQGFPPPNASGAYLESFLRGMAKMQKAVADSADRRGNWISSNGSLAPLRRDAQIGGVMVPAGTTFNEFNSAAARRGKQEQFGSGLQNVLNKYGGGR